LENDKSIDTLNYIKRRIQKKRRIKALVASQKGVMNKFIKVDNTKYRRMLFE